MQVSLVQGNPGHRKADANDECGAGDGEIAGDAAAHQVFAVRDKVAGVEDCEADGAKDDGESQAEGDKKGESEGDAAERNGGQEQDEGGWTRDQAAAGAERDQAADAHFFRDVGVNSSIAMVVREAGRMNVNAA